MRASLAWIAVAGAALLGRGDARAADATLGARLYQERCSPCHGDQGKGDGPTAAALEPKPRNFNDAGFWHGRSLDDLRKVVLGGKPGTMMPPFQGVLTDAEIDAVTQHLRTFDPSSDAPAGGGAPPGR
jgi:mono/diheme cytochrome c family protein